MGFIKKIKETRSTAEDIESLLTTEDLSGTFTYLDAGGEQTVMEIENADGKRIDILGLLLDLDAMTQANIVVKVHVKVDGTTYRQIYTSGNLAASTTGWLFPYRFATTKPVKVTVAEGADETADLDIPFQAVWRYAES